MLAGPKLSATFGNTAESMGTTAAEPQAVPDKKMRSADGVVLVENEAGPANETAATSRPSNWATLTNSQSRSGGNDMKNELNCVEEKWGPRASALTT